ncbi:MAG: hypothetical protein ABIH11_01120 [Candidatus Altiarchaeota archaeon]
MSRNRTLEYIRGREKLVAKLIREGAPLPRIMEELGVDESEGSNIRAGFSRAITTHPELSGALKDRVESIVEQNRRSGRNTSVNELVEATGVGWYPMKAFVHGKKGPGQSINLTPLGDIHASRVERIKAEAAGQGGRVSIKSTARKLGTDEKTASRLVKEAGVGDMTPDAAKSSQIEFQAKILSDILSEHADACEIPETRRLVELNEGESTTPAGRRKLVKTTKREITARLVGMLGEVRAARSSQARSVWEELNETRQELYSPDVCTARARLSRELEEMGEVTEEQLATSLQERVNQTWFGGREVCPYWLPERLVRMDLYGDADKVLHPQVPTPQTLDDVRDQLLDYSKRTHGRKRYRVIHQMSTQDMSKGAPSFYYLLKRKLPDMDARQITQTAIWILTGEEGRTYDRYWDKRGVREDAVVGMLEEAGWDPTGVTTGDLSRKAHGLHMHYKRHEGSKCLRESLVMALREFSELTPEQERFILARRNRPMQMRLILQHLDPGRSVEEYAGLMGIERTAAYNVVRRLQRELTDAVDGGDSVREIADRYGVGARGISNLGLRELERPGGIIRLVGYPVEAGDEMAVRGDMTSLEELARGFNVHTHMLQGISTGRQRPSGRVERSAGLNRLEEHSRMLVQACGRRDYDGMARLAGEIGCDVEGVRKLPEGERGVSVTSRSGNMSIRYVTDARLDEMLSLAGSIAGEAEFR